VVSLRNRLTSRVVHTPGLRPVADVAVRARSVALILRRGLFDLDWYALQTQRSFPSVAAAVRDYVRTGRRDGMSPHPLFEPAWIEPETWRARLTDPLAHYLLSPARRRHRDPHPFFDVSLYLEDHPDAVDHPGGPLASFLATATDDSPLPVPPALLRERSAPPTYGELRAVQEAAVRTRQVQLAARGPRQQTFFDTRGQQAFVAEVAAEAAAARARSGDPPLVTVVMASWNRAAVLRRAIVSVQAQTMASWELLVVDDGSTDDTGLVLEGLRAFDARIRVLAVAHGGVSRARNAGIEAAAGQHVAFLDSDNTWQPEFLELMVAGMRRRGADLAYSAMRLDRARGTTWRAFEGGREALRVGNHIDLNVLVVATELVRRVGGFDPALRRTVDYDLVLKLADLTEPVYLPFVGAVYSEDAADASRISVREPRSWDTVVRARHTLDWSAATPPDALVRDRVSVLVPVPTEWNGALAIIGRLLADDGGGAAPEVADSGADAEPSADAELSQDAEPSADAGQPDAGASQDAGPSQDAGQSRAPGGSRPPRRSARDVEILVLDRAGTRATAVLLAAQTLLSPRLRVQRVPADTGFAFGVDVLLLEATGATAVIVEPSMTLEAGWLGPLVDALGDGVLATSALLLDRHGWIVDAGAVFTPALDLPVPFLAGHPGSEALDRDWVESAAPMSPAIAVRTADLLAVHGLDPLYTAWLADVDLGLRLAEQRSGVFRTVPAALALRTGPLAVDDPLAAADQRIFTERWSGRLPADARAAWARFGTTLAHVATAAGESGATVVTPVVTRPPRAVDVAALPAAAAQTVRTLAATASGERAAAAGGGSESPAAPVPALRWSIMTGTPVGRRRFQWGDWYFAGALAAALRRLGQDAVVNPRFGDDVPLRDLDDVSLTLRGLTAFPPVPGRVHLLWVISHPELVTPAEVAAHDAAFGASLSWSEEMSRLSGVAVEPLLQCTDPERFSPAAAARLAVPAEPVLFVGNSRRVNRPVVEAALAAGVDLAVYGSGWTGLVPAGVLRGGHVPNAELASHYAAAGVVLNDHWDDMRVQGFLSNRLFDVTASGGRVVSDHVEGIEAVFGDAVRTFTQRAELQQMLRSGVASLFPPAAERALTAARIGAEHSFDARAARLLAVALQHQRPLS